MEIVVNGSPSAQNSLLIDRRDGLAAARFLRDDIQLDFCSNATAVDWPDREKTDKVKTRQVVDGVEKEIEQTVKTRIPGYLEMVYHLFSITNREEGNQEPVVLRMHTGNRTDDVTLPSLTPVWRSAEFQEREAYDLFGVEFEGHPDLRRILMWEGFTDHPMRKDYVPPPDDEREISGGQ
ncbi:MAG TPA: NADH-quinone oxidoreductase subunit C [Acidobacteriaceae bacterium]|nr:NADH-quinone oxidoreductase subunit C [Acidobacteriaceae bacterium]